LQQRQRELDGAFGRARAGGVAVEAQHRFGREAPELGQVVVGERGAERGDGALEAGLVQGDDVEVAFGDEQALARADGVARQVEGVEGAALGEDRAVGAVDVFGLGVAQGAAAEADQAAAAIADGEGDAAPIQLAAAAVLGLAQQPGLEDAVGVDAGVAQLRGQGAAAVAAPAEAELADSRLGQAAPEQVGAGGLALALAQAAHEAVLGAFEHGVQVGPLAFDAGLGRGGFGHLEPGFGGQALDGFGEGGAAGLHLEGDGVAVGAAAEAVEMVLVDVEAGALLAVEGAAALPVAAGLAELDPAPDQPRQRRARPQLVEELRRERHR